MAVIHNVTAVLDEDEKGVATIDTPGGQQELTDAQVGNPNRDNITESESRRVVTV